MSAGLDISGFGGQVLSMTKEEAEELWQYIFEERLGILGVLGGGTELERGLAEMDADAAVMAAGFDSGGEGEELEFIF